MDRNAALKVWQDLTRELFPGIQVSALQLAAHAMTQLKPKHVIQSPWMRAPLPASVWQGVNWLGTPNYAEPMPPFDINNGFGYGAPDPRSWRITPDDLRLITAE